MVKKAYDGKVINLAANSQYTFGSRHLKKDCPLLLFEKQYPAISLKFFEHLISQILFSN